MSNLPIFLSSPRENDIFISYAKEDIEFVKKLDAAIRKQNRDPWVDWDDLPWNLDFSTLDPWRYIEAGIKDADLFVFIISPDSLKSERKVRELNLARHYNKRIVPVLWKEPEGDEGFLSELPTRNEWITIRERNNFAIEKLVKEILDIDIYERLLKLARKWNENQQSQDLLLYGQDLVAVQRWRESSDQALKPLQETYLEESVAVESSRPKQPNVFISYSRKDKVFVEAILGKLREQGQKYGLTFWIDWEKIPVSSPWLQRIYSGIERAHTFLFILSPCSAHSEYCRDEIVHAVTHGKRLVPIILAQNLIPGIPPEELDFDLERYRMLAERDYCEELFKQVDPPVVTKISEKTKTVPESWRKMGPLQERNGHFFRQLNHFDDQNVQKLLDDITDDNLEDADYHSELDKEAYRWLNSGRDSKDLLSEEKLEKAEQFRSRWQAGEFKRINLTYPQQEFIEAGVKARSEKRKLEEAQQQLKETQQQLEAERERRKTIRHILVTVISVVGTLLLSSGLVWAQRGRISEMVSSLENVQELDALVRALRAGSNLQGWGLILNRVEPDLKVRVVTALQQEIYNLRERNRLMDPWQERVVDVNYSPDRQFIVAASEGGISVWQDSEQMIDSFKDSSIGLVAFDPGITVIIRNNVSYKRQIFAATGEDGVIRLWQILSRAGEMDAENLSPTDSPIVESLEPLQSAKNTEEDSDTEADKDNAVIDLSFSPGGLMLAAARANGTVDLWWKQDGKTELWQSTSPTTLIHDDKGKSVNRLSFTPYGKRLATAGENGTIKLWTLDNVQRSATLARSPLQHSNAPIYSISFSPNGERLASGSADGVVRLWQADDGTSIPLPGKHESAVYQVIFNPDSQALASAGQDGAVRLWDAQGGQLRRILRGHQGAVRRILFQKDAPVLISASEDDTIRLWAWQEGKLLESLESHRGQIVAIDISPDGKELASASFDRSVKLWNLYNRIQTLPHANRVNDVAFHFYPKSRILSNIIVTGGYSSIKLWQNGKQMKGPDKQEENNFSALKGNVLSLAFSADGQRLVSGGEDGKLRLWKLDLQKNALVMQSEIDSTTPLQADGVYKSFCFQTAGLDCNLISSLQAAGNVPLLDSTQKSINNISFRPNADILAIAGSDGMIRVWKIENSRLIPVQVLQYGREAKSVSFSPDGEWLAAIGLSSEIKLWQIHSTSSGFQIDEAPVYVWNTNQGGGLSVNFNRDKQEMRLASGGTNGSIKLWTLDGKELRDLVDRNGNPPHRDEVYSVSFSPTGELLASASEDGIIKLWTSQGEFITALERHRRGVRSVSFSPDGKMLASAGQDDVVYLWELPDFKANAALNKLMKEGCDLAKDYIQTKPQESKSEPQENEEEVEEIRQVCEKYPDDLDKNFQANLFSILRRPFVHQIKTVDPPNVEKTASEH